ncbi:MAG: PAS domain-containing protein, partial [Desulfovibrio sp.]|nr:PAS domain-containing protein [Desulfovibrio sp.]
MEDRISPDENRQDPEQNAEAQEAEALAQAFSGSTREERERLARIVDLLPCYVVLIDEQRRILFHNKAFEQFFGRPGDKLCYEAMRGLTAPCRVCLPLDPASRNGDGVMEWVQPRSGHAFRVHSYPFAEADGTPRILKVGFNITASLRVQQALDLSEQSYRAITDNLSIGIALLDPKRRIKAGNIRLSQWFGEGFHLDRSICDLLQCGAEYARAIPEPGFTCPDCPFQASLNDGASHEKEISVSFQDGMERIVRLVTCPVKQSKTGPKKRPVRA